MLPIDFRGYSEDCLIHGRLIMPVDARLTDFLNASEVFEVHGTTLYALEDGRPVTVGDYELPAGELWAVEPTDSGKTAWHADLRVATRSIQIRVDMAPYSITGTFHGAGSRPSRSSRNRRRRRLVPLTDASVEFTYMGQSIVRATPVVIFNRERAQRIRRISTGATSLVSRVGEIPVSV